MKQCNPKNPKAKDDRYTCNPKTGRWNLSKKNNILRTRKPSKIKKTMEQMYQQQLAVVVGILESARIARNKLCCKDNNKKLVQDIYIAAKYKLKIMLCEEEQIIGQKKKIAAFWTRFRSTPFDKKMKSIDLDLEKTKSKKQKTKTTPNTKELGPFFYNLSRTDLSIYKNAVENGADVNLRGGQFNRTPVMAILDSGNFKTETNRIVKYLVKHGADVNLKDDRGHTPLIIAVSRANFAMVKFLIKMGADTESLTAKKETILHLIIKSGFYRSTGEKIKMMKYIIDECKCGSPINAMDIYGRSIIYIAVETGESFKFFMFLIDRGADICSIPDPNEFYIESEKIEKYIQSARKL